MAGSAPPVARCALWAAGGLAAGLIGLGAITGSQPGSGAWLAVLDAVEPAGGEPAGGEPGGGEPGGSERERTVERMPDLLAAAADEIEARREGLDRRELGLAAREAALRELAAELGTQLAELQALRQERDAAADRVAQEEEERATRLARLYEAMKPKRAAVILDRIPTEEVASITRRMRDGKAALIIQQMAPERASALSARLSEP